MIEVGKAVLYDSKVFGRKIDATVVDHVEGWYGLRFSDASYAIVRPSRVELSPKYRKAEDN